MAPLAMDKEKGFFNEEGLEVDLWAYPNWKYIQNDVISGKLQEAMLFTGQAIASETGVLGKGDLVNVCGFGHTPTPIVLSTEVWKDVKKNLKKDGNT